MIPLTTNCTDTSDPTCTPAALLKRQVCLTGVFALCAAGMTKAALKASACPGATLLRLAQAGWLPSVTPPATGRRQ